MAEKKELSILACPRCGSKSIEMGTMGQGVLFGLTSWKSVCRNCGYQGEPLMFDTEEEYQKFLDGLAKDKAPEASPGKEPESVKPSSEAEETAGFSPKEQEVLQDAERIEQEAAQKVDHRVRAPVFSESKSWRVEVGVAMVIAAVWTMIYLYVFAFHFFTSLELLFMFLYVFFYFTAVTLVALVLIIIAEYIYYRRKRVP